MLKNKKPEAAHKKNSAATPGIASSYDNGTKLGMNI